MPRCILPYLKVRLSEDNAKGKFMKQRYFLVVMFLLVSLPYIFFISYHVIIQR